MNILDLQNYTLEGDLLRIRTFPDPVLKKIAKKVTTFDAALEKLCKDMLFTMYHAPGIGLAAPQIGKSIRLFVLDVDYKREKVINSEGNEENRLSEFKPHIFINPVIKNKEGTTTYEEGCLSVPGVYEDVDRAEKVTIEYQDLQGNHLSLDADELLAICLQHENDHLEGLVFLDRLGAIKKKLATRKYLKSQEVDKI